LKIPSLPPWGRLVVRACLLAFFLLLSLSGILPGWLDGLTRSDADSFAPPKELAPGYLKAVLPALSPLAVFSSALSQRELMLTAAAGLAFLALLLAVWRGRFFCAWICPLGTLAEFEARLVPKTLLKKPLPRVNGIVFFAILIGAFLGIPVLLAFDPLAIFNRLPLALHWPFALAALLPGSMLAVALLLGLLRPMLWCSNVCPLGYGLGLAQRARYFLAKLGAERKLDNDTVVEVRRDLLKGACVGIPLAVASEGLMVSAFESNEVPVLPPGAGNAVDFHASCTRCYACLAACPSKVLSVEMPKSLDIPAWFAPQLLPRKSSCWEDCNRCSQVCAPGAIKPISVEEKKNLQIGVARVDQAHCIAWAKGETCMVCDEYCPYKAIASEPNPDGVPRPVILKDKCRGCGFCEMSCPARNPGPAIKVAGVLTQKRLQL
jgi:polyferredoxin/Pyruvate/2-oxoacid:ferredoxin oxidoreductase delta subunit